MGHRMQIDGHVNIVQLALHIAHSSLTHGSSYSGWRLLLKEMISNGG